MTATKEYPDTAIATTIAIRLLLPVISMSQRRRLVKCKECL